MDEQTAQTFESALRDAGAPKLLLHQVVMIYQRTFPANAMRPDMRARLHDALLHLADIGIVNWVEENDEVEGDPLSLPHAIEFEDAEGGSLIDFEAARADVLL